MKLLQLSSQSVRFGLAVMLPLVALFAYNFFLFRTYESEGMKRLPFDPEAIAVFVVWATSSYFCLPREMERPSDVFVLLYMLLCGIWGATLWGATGYLSHTTALFALVLLHSPIHAFNAIDRLIAPDLKARVPLVQQFAPRYLTLALLVILVMAVVLTLSAAGAGGFDFGSLYDRRLIGRETMPPGSLQAYLFNMSVNGAGVLLGYLAGRHLSVLATLCAVGFAVYAYWLIGLRSPFLNIAMMMGLGVAVRLGLLARLPHLVLAATLCASLVFFLELGLTGYSLVGDYLIRRIALVQPEVQSFYVDAILRGDIWGHLAAGIPHGGSDDITYYIGLHYLNDPLTNANTNGFLYAFAKQGIPGYLLAIASVSALLIALNSYYVRTGTSTFLAIGCLFGIILSEQSYSAALISSGILLCTITAGLFSGERLQSGTLQNKAS